MRKLIGVFTICFMVITLFSGCSILQKLGLQKNNDELHPVSSVVMNEDEARKLTDKVPIHLYFGSEDNSRLKLEVRYIPVSEAKKSVSNLASTIVRELIKGPSSEGGLKATIPSSAALRGPVSINAGIATVDFTKDFIDKHPGGKAAEQVTIYSIVNSLTELKEIEKVKFTINGKEQKDFKGNFQFNAPFPRSPALISKEVPPAGDAAKNKVKQGTDKSNPASPSPKPQVSPKKDTVSPAPAKNADTKNNSINPSSGGKNAAQSPAKFDEDAEATYLEIIE